MSWSEIKKKKEEEEKKRASKKSNSDVSRVANNLTGSFWKNIGQNIITSQRNAEIRKQKEQQEQKRTNSVQSMPTTYKRTLEPTVTRTMSQGNNASFVKQSDLKNQKLETVQENTTWGNIVNFVKNTGRTLENIKTGAYTNLIGLSQTAIRDISDVDKAYSEGKSAIRNTLLPLLGDKGKQVNNYLNEQGEKNYAKRNEALNSGLQVLSKEKQKANEDIQRNVLGAKLTDSSVATKMAEIAPSIGQQIPGFAFNAISPVASLLYFKGSAEANYYDDAISRGMEEKQAKIYSKLMSYVEAGTEQLSVGNISKGGKTITTALKEAKKEGLKKGLKAGFDVFKETAKEETANTLKSAFKDYGIGVAEEAFQEAITEPIQEFTAMKVAGEDKADWNNMWQRMLQSGFDGALSSAILAGANLGISSCQGIVTKIENGQDFTTEEYNTAIKDASQKINIEKLTTDQIKEKVNQLKGELQQPQVEVNKNADQQNKTSQNGTSQVLDTTEKLRQEAREKLESIKQNYDENSYNQMQEFIETAPSEKALNQVINDLNKEAETKQVAPLKQKQEVQLPMQQTTQNKSFEDVAFEAMSNYESNEVESPLKNRDMDSIGKQTKVNAYQYDNPQVKPYFQEMAQQMGEDLAYISSPENRSTKKGGGTKLSTSTKAMDILHNEQGYSYDQIAQGLQNIIDDKGSENNAISKKIELVIDEQLRNGYNNAFGKYVEPNQEYINTIQGNKDVQLPMKQKQEVSLPLNENVVNNQNTSQEQYSLTETQPQNNFKYEQTDNEKVNKLYESTSKYFDDSQKTHNMLKPMEKIIRDKGYNITFDDTLDDNVNGRIRTNQETGETEITINPNSNRKGEFIIGHELTHAIETQEMVDLVKKRMEKDGELRNAVEDLKKLYGTDDINGEVLADISGQLFGNQEFINNLSVEKPSIFKRIYDTIVSLANKITGNSSEALFIKDLKNKWEKAYRENNNNIREEQYSIAGEKSLTANINKLNQAKELKDKGLSDQDIYKQTGWYKSVDGKWKYEIDDSDFNIKDVKIEPNETYELNEILDAPELFEAYPKLKNILVSFDDIRNKGEQYSRMGYEYITINNDLINNHSTINDYNLLGIKNQSKVYSTLMHEIQHVIQDYEDFAKGASIDFWSNATTDINRKYEWTQKDYKRFKEEIGLDKYEEKLFKDFKNKKITGSELVDSIDAYIDKKGYTEKFERLSKIQQDLLNKKYKLEGSDAGSLYYFTAGEIEARAVQDRINKNSEWKKENIPTEIAGAVFAEDYTDNPNTRYSLSEDTTNLPEVKEGYTRLYRGLESEYNPQYDKNKLDNVNGYESWTDNYDLAKSYGDNVYYIDVPTSEIKNSILDEDTTSETYGDRNLIYKNDKPVGINGKNGNEYMLYTEHDNYNNIKYNKVNNQTSTQDNQGRTLSKQQQEYFKDSKVRDKNGNLLTVYHGTNSEFNIFDLTKGGQSNTGASIGFWFTETKQGAENFANDVWYGDKKPNVKENYLDLKNPKVYENVQNEELKEQYRKQSDELENKAKEIRKEYSWDKTDYKTTMTFDTLIRDYQTANYKKEKVDLELFEGLAKERGFNEEQISNMERDAKKYVELLQESKNATNEYYKLRYGDAYEQFKIDLYETAGQTAEEANTGGLGMALNNPKETVEKFRNKLIKEGYDGIIIKNTQYDNSNFNGENNQYVAFYPNQIKNVDNKTPTTNPDIRYSKQNNSWQDYLEKNYKSEGTTTDLRDIRLPMKEKQEVKLPMKQENTQQTQEQNNNTKGEAINWNEIERPEENRKFRKHYKSIIESDNTTAEAKSIAKDLMGTDTYVPETNKGQLAQADQRIMTSSPEVELQALRSRVLNGERITSVDIAVGERLIQYFSKTGSAEQLQDAIQTTALAGTSTGQTLQALTILNHQTPQGQVTWLQRSIDKMNKELAKKKGGTITTDADGNIQIVNKQGKDITNKVDLFNLTPEMMNKIMQSENQEQMLQNIDEVYEELGQQVPKSMLEKVDSWRYFSMLANMRTHGRNMIGNFAMGKMQRVKDKIAGGIEDVVSKFNPEMERTKTLRRADKKTKEFAKNDFKNVEVQSRLELNESKFNPQSRLQNARRTFKSDAMENTLGRLFNLNDKLLEAEDGIGLKAGYQKALADYITANKIDVDNITDAQLGKARNYAIQQAKEATFHQANAIASAVTQFQNKNNVTKFFTDALLPFKKTPMNVAKAGMEYSPLQIAKSATVDLVNLRKGNISVNQYIDNLSKGMTGTGIALVGYALANAGILKASGGDDKDKEKYDEEQGKQSYSIQIAGKTYSLDWLAPTGIPLFIGAETHKLFNQEETEKSTEKRSEEDRLNQAIKGASNLLNAGATAINPMSEMSMISGLTSALSSYNTSDNLGSLGNMMTNMGKSYVNQFFPTLMGQVAKTGDEYERTTKSTAKGTIGKAVDQTINQIKNKVPGLRQTLPIKTDIWGKDVKQEVNLPLRAVNNFINPATVKEVSTDKVDMELNKLYEENHSSSLLPDILTKTVQLNKQTYRLSNKEYAEFTKNYGQTSHKLIENFIKTSDYNKLTQEQKETAISNIYSYAKEQNKMDYAKKVNETVKPSTLYTTMKEIEKDGGKQSEYLNYLAKTKGMSKESEKNKVLADSNYSNKTKEIIYTNGTGKDDNLYNNLLSKSHINMTEYLDYKDKVSSKVFSADKDKNGKTVTGSAKAKVINYLNNNITGVGNRLLIAGKSYALQNNEKQKLAQYINSIANTREERIEIYKQLDKNFYVRNGKVYMRVSK